jgi:hypothetical protein
VKTHRLYRHSTRVSSDTGVAYSAMIGDPGPTRHQVAKEEIVAILRRFPPDQRRAMLAELAREVLNGVSL